MKKLLGVEIFKTGTWHGKKYTTVDIDNIIMAWRDLKDTWFRPAIKDGHHHEKGKRALGYLDNLRRVGERLVCDLVDLPETVYGIIKEHGYDRVSLEAWFNREKNGKKYPIILTALAILGSEIPEVSGLKPLRESFEGAEFVSFDIEGDIFEKWSTAYINDLPDAAFAVIKAGGEKDDEGKTVPRDLRMLPHHTAAVESGTENNTLDMPHLRNALARLPQADMSAEERARVQGHLDRHMNAVKENEGGYTMDPLVKAQKELEESQSKVKELEARIGEMSQLETQVKELTAKLEATHKAATNHDVGKDIDGVKVAKLTSQVGELTTKLEALKTELEAKSKSVEELTLTARKTAIERKASALRVPALAPYVEQFYSWAAESSDLVTFSVDGKEKKDLLREQVVDGFIEAVNGVSKALFSQTEDPKEIYKREETTHFDNPGAEVDRRVREYQAKNASADYEVALDAVLTADPDLKAAYAG